MEEEIIPKKYAEVILDLSIDKPLDYEIPQNLLSEVRRGMKVQIPLRGHLREGFVLDIKDHTPLSKIFSITKVLSEHEMISPSLFELALWMSKYYCTSLSQVIKLMLPAIVRKEGQHKEQLFVMRNRTREELKKHCIELRSSFPAQAEVLDVMLMVKKGILLSELLEKTKGSRSPIDTLIKKGLLSIDKVRIDRSPLINEEYFPAQPKQLNVSQSQALEKIKHSLDNHLFQTHLLYGVTGSGKTEVYLQAINCALEHNKGTIMLVPEIALTAQTIERFRSRFEGKIAILHHRLSQGERFDEWHKILKGEAKIVIGARSAVFSPIQNLGLLIVDEEHEHSYKQSEEMPSYHARDVAVMRGKIEKATVILGSATPSLESYYNTTINKYTLSKLGVRADTATLPKVTIVDMKREFEKAQGLTNFSEHLLDGIKKRVELGEQTLLFLNRRGYHTTLFCHQCRSPVRCHHCDVALTFHLKENILACHLCGYSLMPPPTQCPLCQTTHPMKYRGVGTEQVEKALHAIFPNLRTLRMDADTTRHKGSHQKLLREFGTGKADVLIGTQMIAKGLHFPLVTLVGILNSDASLNIPDFRASETVFQLITQVSGRAGRSHLPGEVILQSCMPDNRTIQLAAEQNYEQFYQEELASRQLFQFPPFSQLIKVIFSGPDQTKTFEFANLVRNRIINLISIHDEIHPVIPAGYAKIKDRFRFQFLIRGPKVFSLARALDSSQKGLKISSKIKMLIDVNPTSTFF